MASTLQLWTTIQLVREDRHDVVGMKAYRSYRDTPSMHGTKDAIVRRRDAEMISNDVEPARGPSFQAGKAADVRPVLVEDEHVGRGGIGEDASEVSPCQRDAGLDRDEAARIRVFLGREHLLKQHGQASFVRPEEANGPRLA
jgi:hypothetical protein